MNTEPIYRYVIELIYTEPDYRRVMKRGYRPTRRSAEELATAMLTDAYDTATTAQPGDYTVHLRFDREGNGELETLGECLLMPTSTKFFWFWK